MKTAQKIRMKLMNSCHFITKGDSTVNTGIDVRVLCCISRDRVAATSCSRSSARMDLRLRRTVLASRSSESSLHVAAQRESVRVHAYP